MDKIKIPTSFNIELDFQLANLAQRFFGWLIDLIIQVIYIIIAFQMLSYFFSFGKIKAGDATNAYDMRAWQYLVFSPVLLYHLVSEVAMNGQSIGKKITGIKVISETGNRASFYQFLLRWLIRPFETIFFFVPVLLSLLINKKHQRLGDLAAGTLVIVSRVKSNIDDTIFFHLDETYKPRYENVLQLSDRDMNIIKTILDASLKQKNVELAERTSAKIRTALQINDYQPPVEFLETVLKDYNYLSDQN